MLVPETSKTKPTPLKCDVCELRGVVSYQRKLESLYQLAIEVVALRDLQQVLNISLNHCLELTRSQFGFIGLITEDNRALDLAAITGFEAAPEFYTHNRLIPLRRSVFGTAIIENRPTRSDNVLTDSNRIGQPPGHPVVRTFLGVPLRVREQTIGMIGVANKETHYTDEDEHVLVTYASLVAIAIQNANLYAQLKAARQELERKVEERTQELTEAKEDLAQKAEHLQRLLEATVDVQETERARIAHDMHDGVTQLIISALYETQSVKESLALQNNQAADDHLGDAQDLLIQIDTEIRRIIYDLRPPILDAMGLVPAIKQLCRRCQQYGQVACVIQICGEPYRLPANTETAIYRLVQEALNNVRFHAKATDAEIQINFQDKNVSVVVQDNGIGFDLNNLPGEPGEHLGLISMRERVQSIGGQVNIQTLPGQGAQITFLVPVEERV